MNWEKLHKDTKSNKEASVIYANSTELKAGEWITAQEGFVKGIEFQEHKPESEENISIERINKYARHQFNRGALGLSLVPFEEWAKNKDLK